MSKTLKNLPAQVDLPALERGVLARWERDRVFERSLEQTAGGEPWVFYEGPPTANGKPGTHHVEVQEAGKTPWHVGPVLKYENSEPLFRRLTVGAYFGEPKASFRVHLGYEYWEDDLGTHDGRVVTQALIVF